MAKIEGFRIRNFKTLKDVTLGYVLSNQEGEPLTPMTAVIGKNGVGKSALFDAFSFLADALKSGVEEACDSRGRGGFERIRSQGYKGGIEFEIYYREDRNSQPITYEIAIYVDGSGRPIVPKEHLSQSRKGQKSGRPYSFLALSGGQGVVWKGHEEGQQINEEQEGFDLSASREWIRSRDPEEVLKKVESVELDDIRKLGIATLGSLKQHPRISAFRRFIEGWYLSYFTPDAARSLPLAGPQRHLNIHGDNLGNVVQFMEREHPDRFKGILNRIAKKIPGVNQISTEKTKDSRLLLRFDDEGFQDPFYAQQMSDGTLKLFAYLLLLEDPTPPPFLCIEEPENGLYHKLLESLTQEFRDHAARSKGGSQVFITTHQPYLVDALDVNEVWILEKGADGYSTIRRASDDPLVKNLVEEELPLGGLWFSDYLDVR